MLLKIDHVTEQMHAAHFPRLNRATEGESSVHLRSLGCVEDTQQLTALTKIHASRIIVLTIHLCIGSAVHADSLLRSWRVLAALLLPRCRPAAAGDNSLR